MPRKLTFKTFVKKTKAKNKMDASKRLEMAIKEVHKNMPSTVMRASVSGMKKEKMMRAIAYEKARAKGAKLPRRKGRKNKKSY